MANANADTILLATRQLSNTVTRKVVTDPEVIDRANEGLRNLYDLIDGVHGTAFLATQEFTLVGGIGFNTSPLPSDFYHAKGVDRFLGASLTSPRVSVPQMPSYEERNNPNRRSYDLIANNVVVSPPSLAMGNFELQYIPKCPVIAQIVSIPHVSGDDVVASTMSWFFNSGTFTSADVGQVITVVGSGLVGGDGTFTITSVLNAQSINTTGPTGNGALGPSTVVTYQPGGTIYALPDMLNEYVLYPELFAAITIVDKQNLDSGPLQERLEQQRLRVVAAARARRDQPFQAPMRRRRGWGFWGRGWFG